MTDNATDSHGSPNDASWNPRSRPIVSCLNCRRKKQKCDRLLPCNGCIKSGRPSSCQYAPGQEPCVAGAEEDSPHYKRRRTDEVDQRHSCSPVTNVKFDDLQERVGQLERAFEAQGRLVQLLTKKVATDSDPPHMNEHDQGQDKCYKRREFRLYQPLHSQVPDLQAFVNSLDRGDVPQEIFSIASNLRSLSQQLEQLKPKEGAPSAYDHIGDVLADMARILPSESDCKVLVDIYFQAFEGPLRVLHPIAKTQFRAFFSGQLIPSQRLTCLPTLLAVVSIASTLGTCHECENPTLHGQDGGIGTYQLLRNYLRLLTERQWEQLPILQIAVLTLKSHKSSQLTPVQTWQWSGEIVRRAMAAGIHDTSWIEISTFEGEIKRRLWLTVLEMDLTFAIASNMPATCPVWDGEAPLSVNDGKLYPLMEDLPASGDTREWTDGICQHFLSQSFNDRRAAYALVSSNTLAPYNTILQHTRHLEQVIHDLPQVFRLAPTSESESDSPYRLLAKMELDFLLRRPLNACYAAHGAEMPASDDFREARIPWIQGCSFSICFQDLFDPNYPSVDLPVPEGLWDFYHNVYDWDVDRFFLASCLELQRLRLSRQDAIESASQSFQGHTLREPVKIMGWTIESLIKSLEDTISPTTRRLGRFGGDLGEVVRWTAVIGALRVDSSRSQNLAIKKEIQELVTTLRAQLHHRGASLHSQYASPAMPDATARTDLEWLKEVLLNNEGGNAT